MGLAILKEFAAAYPDRIFNSPLTDLMIKSGRNGIMYLICCFIFDKH